MNFTLNTKQRRARLIDEAAAGIRSAARFSRTIDPCTRGGLSHAGFCGGLQSIIELLAAEIGGQDACNKVRAAFEHAYDDSTADAQAAVAKAAGVPA